jgi:addiction module RelE/StbE family toxin
MVKIKLSGRFDKDHRELINVSPEVESVIVERVKVFTNKTSDSRVRNHKLTGKLLGKWAFSITDDIRIVYEWKSKNTVRFLAIGGHEKVYGRK